MLDLDAPTVLDALTATFVDPADADGDAVGLLVSWQVDGVEVATEEVDADGASTAMGLWVKGQTVRVVATPWDGTDLGTPVELEVVVADSPPSATGATLSPDPLTTADTATCTGEGWSDPDGDAEGWQTTWTIDGVVVSTDPTLAAGTHLRGQVVGCSLLPDDGELTGTAVTAAEVTVTNAAPTCSAVDLAIGPDPATIADTFAITTETSTGCADADGDAPTRVYDWQVDGVTAGAGTTLSGVFDRGETVALTAGWSDGTVTGAAVSSNAVPVVNDPPEISSLTLSPSPAYTDDDLSVGVTASDLEGDTVTCTYAWTVDGIAYTSTTTTTTFTGDTVPASGTTNGQTWACTVTASDGADATSGSDSVTVGCDRDADGYDDVACGGSDCADTDAAVNPGATEVCDASDVDEDCDGLADDADPSLSGTTYYPDADGDGDGDASAGVVACSRPSGYLTTGDDCDDTNAQVKPGGTERCDSADVDEDCDGLADDADSSPTGRQNQYPDLDGDGYGDETTSATYACPGLAGYVTSHSDCDDGDAAVSPAEAEVCDDGLDNNCDEAPFPCGLDGTGDEDDAFYAAMSYNNVFGEDMAYGDFNGDGAPDFVADSYTYDRYHLFLGPFSAGTETEEDDDVRVTVSNDWGMELESAGDANDDGFDDLLVLATGSTSRVYLVEGSASLADTTLSSVSALLSFSAYGEVAGAGDFDDDGVDDFWVAHNGYSTTTETDHLYLYSGASSGPTNTATWTSTAGYVAQSMLGGTDWDGDGIDDLLVASYASGGTSGVFLLEGGASPAGGSLVAATDAWVVNSGALLSVWDTGDVDGDGWLDVGVGTASGSSNWLYLFQGPPTATGLTTSSAYATATGTGATAGDLDDDGNDELYVTSTSTVYGYDLPLAGGSLGSPFVTLDYSGYYSAYPREPDASRDFSGDGVDDLVFGLYSGGSRQYVLLYTGGNP